MFRFYSVINANITVIPPNQVHEREKGKRKLRRRKKPGPAYVLFILSLFCSPRSHFTTLYVVLRGPLWHGMVYIAGNSCRIILLNFSINVESKAYCKKMKSKYIFLYSFSQSNLCYRLLCFLFEK